MSLLMRWVPGHKDIKGNERADVEAKKAAQGDSTPDKLLPQTYRGTLPHSRTAAQQQLLKELKEEAAASFAKSPRFRRLHEVDSSVPSPKFQKIVSFLPRRHASLLIQLRTGHIPLSRHLFTIGKADSPTCTACRARDETVHHFLLTCTAFARQRRTLDRQLGLGARSLKCLLSSPKALPHLFNFINSTRRLRDSFGDVATHIPN